MGDTVYTYVLMYVHTYVACSAHSHAVHIDPAFLASVLLHNSPPPPPPTPSCTPLLCGARSVVIHNRSDVVVHYEWKAFSSDLEEQAEKDM